MVGFLQNVVEMSRRKRRKVPEITPGQLCGPMGLPASFNEAYQKQRKALRNEQLGLTKTPWRKKREKVFEDRLKSESEAA